MADYVPGRSSGESAENESPLDEPMVCLVDDDAAVLQSLAALLEANGLESRSYTRATNLLRQFDPDDYWCIVTDWRMPDLSGLELLEQLRSRGFANPVVMLTAFADVPMVVQAIRSGALTVLQKPCKDHELIGAVRQAIEIERARRARDRVKDDIRKRIERLSTGEREVMELALAGKMNREIAQELTLGLRTVEKRRHNVMKKMQAESLAELMRLMMMIEEWPLGKPPGSD